MGTQEDIVLLREHFQEYLILYLFNPVNKRIDVAVYKESMIYDNSISIDGINKLQVRVHDHLNRKWGMTL